MSQHNASHGLDEKTQKMIRKECAGFYTSVLLTVTSAAATDMLYKRLVETATLDGTAGGSATDKLYAHLVGTASLHGTAGGSTAAKRGKTDDGSIGVMKSLASRIEKSTEPPTIGTGSLRCFSFFEFYMHPAYITCADTDHCCPW